MKQGRNEPCWCGSGKKYKKCHYLITQSISEQKEKSPDQPDYTTLTIEKDVTIKPDERGVITPANDVYSIEDHNFSMSAFVAPEKLRYFVLYWDKVILTESSFGRSPLNSEMELLAKAGVLGKCVNHIFISGPTPKMQSPAKVYIDAMAEAAYQMHDKDPGRWTIHYPDALSLSGNKTAEMYTAKIELLNCLPIPRADIPLNELLDFKLRKRDELIGLREALDELYAKIASSNDIPHSKLSEISRLEKAMVDWSKCDDGNIFSRLLSTRTTIADVGLREVAVGAWSGLAVGSQWSTDPIVGLGLSALGAASGAASNIRFEFSTSRQLKNSAQLDLSYLSSMKEEGVIEK